MEAMLCPLLSGQCVAAQCMWFVYMDGKARGVCSLAALGAARVDKEFGPAVNMAELEPANAGPTIVKGGG